MKKYMAIGFIFISALTLAACTNDIVRERVIEIDDKYDKLCVEGPVNGTGEVGAEVCTTDKAVITDFKAIIEGIDAKKIIREADLIEYTKTLDREGSYMFGLYEEGKSNSTPYFVTAHQDGIFQFPEIGTMEMRYFSKENLTDKFEAVTQFVSQNLTDK